METIRLHNRNRQITPTHYQRTNCGIRKNPKWCTRVRTRGLADDYRTDAAPASTGHIGTVQIAENIIRSWTDARGNH